ncbi:4Fe-4S dicluster domain-containing protein [Candidatus Acetothermia bacterium]|nr:4Fe-4S dicluster domain-containing protein [Candidatus Acetothermia bacterium]MBI3644009.1 4Fe-4S dicluster domain-containing protein [Candidatus Acetothermia bacterium]
MAIIGTLKTFKGGHYFKTFEGTPSGSVVDAPLPKRVIIPLRQGFGDEAALLVSVGDSVKTGQIIARSDEKISTPILSSITGRVTSIREEKHPIDGKPTLVVAIEGSGADEWQRLRLLPGNFERWGGAELGRVLYEAGVTALGKSGLPTTLHSSTVEPDKIKYLLINAVETEPYLEVSKTLLYEEFEKFVSGIKVLKAALGNIEVHVGIGYDQPQILEEIANRLEYHDWLFLHPLLPKYPQGEDEVLIKSLLNLEVPSGQLSTAIGVVVVSTPQVIAAYDAAIEGKPLVEALISIGGSAVDRPVNARVRIGTPAGELLHIFGHQAQSAIILGGPMRGTAVDETTPILRDSTALLALKRPKKRLLGGLMPGFGLDSYARIIPPILGRARKATTGLNGPESSCIQCGYCVDVCPQNLFPIWIAQAADQGQMERAQELDIFACIDCGLCSYVCPSKIPVLEQIQKGKHELREERLQE